MKEIKDIIGAYDELVKQGKQAVLATVVHVEGSSYRRPGARMLVSEEGALTGAISGGCLEGDALRKAMLVMIEKRNMLVTYDTNDEEDATLGMGLGCNGIIQVLIEYINESSKNNPIELLRAVAAKREPAVLVSLFNLQDKKAEQPGTCFLLNKERIIVTGTLHEEEAIKADAKKVLENNTSSFKNYISSSVDITAFLEFIQPPVSLVIAGAGNDVMPLVEMAQILGWEVTVLDGRGNYAKKERFPGDCQVFLARPEELLKLVTVDDQTVFALMTHNYNYDLAMLKEILKRNAVYIGLLGPKKKRDRLLEELKEGGMNLTVAQLATIHGPVGLDIGAETSEEIALSILAEIKAVLSEREGRQLKAGDGPIHSRAETKIEKINIAPK